MSAVLEVSGLKTHFFTHAGVVKAVDGVDFTVSKGEIMGFLGPNGAGKTSTMEVFEGLREPDGGEVTILGDQWKGDGRALRRQ